MENLLDYIKALHIIFVITWFAGLFYIVRLFVYHAEADKKDEPDRSILINQYKIMEKRLWYFITWPSMVLVIVFGFWIATPFMKQLGQYGWLILKLGLVAGLVLYHIQCQVMFTNLKNDKVKYTPLQLRLWNEVATILLVSIIFVVVLRDALNWLWGLAGLVILGLVLWTAIRMYKAKRERGEAQKEKRPN